MFGFIFKGVLVLYHLRFIEIAVREMKKKIRCRIKI